MNEILFGILNVKIMNRRRCLKRREQTKGEETLEALRE